jgi:polar amino acid transport system substrate-binding protein
MKRSTFLFAALMVVMVLVLTACANKNMATTSPNTSSSSETSWADIQKKGYFVMGVTDTYAPMGFRDKDNNNVGFDIDLAKAVAAKLGIEVKLNLMDWDSKLVLLNNKTIDTIWCGFSVTEERKKEVTFSNDYISNVQVIIVPADSPVNAKADLAGKILAWQLGSSADDAVKADPIYPKLGGERTYNNMPEAFMDMTNKRVDAVVLDSLYFDFYATTTNTRANYKQLSDTFGNETMAVGTRLTDVSWSQKLNEALTAVKNSPEGVAISQKWFGEDVFVK